MITSKRRHCEEAIRPTRQSIFTGLLRCARNDLCLLLSLLLFAPFIAQAKTPPLPQNKSETIGSFDAQLKEERERQEALELKMKSIKGDMGKIREELIRVGKSIRENENTMQTLEDRIKDLEKQQSGIEETLDDDRASISRLILALQRIRRLPPEAIIARPGAPLDTAQSAMLLQEILPTLNNRATALRENLEELARIREELRADRRRAIVTSTTLNHEQHMLSGLLDERERLYTDANEDYRERERAVKKISAQASNLQDLVSRLEEDRNREATRKSAQKAVHSVAPPVAEPAFIPRSGEARLPVSGIITVKYGESDDFGADSKGVTIIGRNGALVVAPMGGVVRFAGSFKRHGNMVILEHKKDYHSLIAGLEKIDTVVGQTLDAGEPIGTLNKNNGDQSRPKLYYELRYKGKPVNPSRKFAELK